MLTEVYPEYCKTSKMELFVKVISNFEPLTILTKNPILDVWQSSE